MACRSFAIRVPFLLCLFFGISALAKKKPPAQPVNINTANSEQLQTVPGIGPATAGKILEMRKSYAAFKSVEVFLAIPRLGSKRLEKNWQVFDGLKTSRGVARANTTAAPPSSLTSPLA